MWAQPGSVRACYVHGRVRARVEPGVTTGAREYTGSSSLTFRTSPSSAGSTPPPSAPDQKRGKMLRSRLALFVASAFLLCASRASEVEAQVPGAKFNKDELEAILKKEHSDRVSNIYDSENGIQRRRLSNKCPGTLQPVRPLVAAKGPPTSPRAAPLSLRGHGRAELSGGRPSLAGTRGTWTTRSSVPVWTASAPRKSCRTVRQKDVCGEVRVPVRYGGVGRCLLERVVLYTF